MPSFWPFGRKSEVKLERIEDTTETTPRRRLFGRDYTVGVPYMMPTDDSEMNRLDFQHYMLRYALKGNYAAPIRNPRNILDVGCGTGRWAREMAEQFPRAHVIGTDLQEPTTDERANAGGRELRPDNYTFVPGNVFEGLPFGDASFDYVHQRLLFFAIPADKWQSVFNELYRVTSPGGWVESVEGSLSLEPHGPTYDVLTEKLLEAMVPRGMDPRYSSRIGEYMQQAGFRNVKVRKVGLPVGAWAGRIGKMVATDMSTILEAVRPLYMRNGMSAEQFDATIQTMKQEWEQYRSHWVFYIGYGQRVS